MAARISRTNASRTAQARPAVGGTVEPLRLEIDTSKLPAGFEATWVREMIAGEYDGENIQRALETRGMRPATYDELNLPAPPVLPGREKETHGLIRRGGSILMVRPVEVAEDERDALAQANEDAIRAANNARDFKSKASEVGAEVPASENRIITRESKGDGRFKE